MVGDQGSVLLVRVATAIRSRSRSLGEMQRKLVSEMDCFWMEACATHCGHSGRRLVCHCRTTENCHGDVLIEEFRKPHHNAYDGAAGGGAPPEPAVLSFMARLREEAESDEDRARTKEFRANPLDIAALDIRRRSEWDTHTK